VWHRIVAALSKFDEITDLDKIPLSVYCRNYEQWIDAVTAINQFGPVIKSTNGFPVQSPYVSIANNAESTMLKIAAEYGFTPASRRRVFPPKFKSYTFDKDGNQIEM